MFKFKGQTCLVNEYRRKIISLRKLVSDLCPIAILTEEIAVEVTEVVGVSLHCKMTVRYKISVNCKICLKSTKNTNKNLQILRIFLTLPVILFAFNYLRTQAPVIPCEIYG
jgi:hypothetical protein